MSAVRRTWQQIRGLFTRRRSERRMQEEFAQHLAMAMDDHMRAGLTEAEARRRAEAEFGAAGAMREGWRDQWGLPWLDALLADFVFGWRQLRKHRVASAAAILSMALATGACLAAFRLMDALLWRPLPVVHAEELYGIGRAGVGFDGKPSYFDGWAHPVFQQMRTLVAADAELLAVSYADRTDVTYGSDAEMEKATVQYVSGAIFSSFGLQAAAGRLLTMGDDRTAGAHPVAVLTNQYWTRRFARDSGVVGRTFRYADRVFEIVGVGPEGYAGTETGVAVDVFFPAIMNPAALRDDSTWHRTLMRIRPGVDVETLRQRLDLTSRNFETERMRGVQGTPRELRERIINQTVTMEQAASGMSGMQRTYRRALTILGVLVFLVLLIGCANVGNLMTAQATARGREMALRVSIGAGRWRLFQLVLVESAILAALSALLGGVFAWKAAPFLASQINPPDNPAHLILPLDYRVLLFGAGLTAVVILLFGLAPALRASGVHPMHALKGGTNPHERRRSLHFAIALQVTFCFLILFGAGLFSATFAQLRQRPLGFNKDRVLLFDTIAAQAQGPAVWEEMAEHLRALPGVESLAVARYPLLNGSSMNNFVSVDGAPPGPVLAYFLDISPGFLGTMQIRLSEGRDFRPDEWTPRTAIVNETFARHFFGDRSPVGRTFTSRGSQFAVVGVAKDTPYRNVREATLPVAFTPLRSMNSKGVVEAMRQRTFVVRMSEDRADAIGPAIRREISRLRPDFQVSSLRTQAGLIEMQTVRERLLALVALFFAGVGALLAGIGLFGVLDYSVLQRRREIGIRVALGSPAGSVAVMVTKEAALMVGVGILAGLGLGVASARFVESLLYGVTATEPAMLGLPAIAILVVAAAAAVAPVWRALRVDPIAMLRAD